MKHFFIIYTSIDGKISHITVEADNEAHARSIFWKQFANMGCQIKCVAQV